MGGTPDGVLSRDAEKDEDCLIELPHFRSGQCANASAQALPPNRRDLVRHDTTGFRKPIFAVRGKRDTKQWGIGWIAGQRTDSHGTGVLEAIILYDHDRTGFSSVIATARSDPQLSPLHPKSISPMASTKSWSDSACSLLATASDCLRASSANPGARVSGTHTCRGRSPCSRKRVRCR